MLKDQAEQEPLDPYLVGRIAGPKAFVAGDWVVLRNENNRPARVCHREPSDFPGAIRVVLDQWDHFHSEACYGAGDLGYPLSKELWSQSQIEWYRRSCKEEKKELTKQCFNNQELFQIVGIGVILGASCVFGAIAFTMLATKSSFSQVLDSVRVSTELLENNR